MSFNKEQYWERRKQGLRGQMPGSHAEIRQEVKKRFVQRANESLADKVTKAIKKEKKNVSTTT